MITLRYFASLSETLGVGEERIELPDGITDVTDLTRWLQGRGESWRHALADKRLNVAVNREIVTPDARIGNGDEIAWFPPVTGG